MLLVVSIRVRRAVYRSVCNNLIKPRVPGMWVIKQTISSCTKAGYVERELDVPAEYIRGHVSRTAKPRPIGRGSGQPIRFFLTVVFRLATAITTCRKLCVRCFKFVVERTFKELNCAGPASSRVRRRSATIGVPASACLRNSSGVYCSDLVGQYWVIFSDVPFAIVPLLSVIIDDRPTR